jgi:threonine aldolase
VKYLFYDDYSEGAHAEILRAVSESNDGQDFGYGNDRWCELAADRISARLKADVDVHFVAGGTQANQISMASMLLSYQGVIAPVTAHLNVHESGATEATGHKILAIPSVDGKLVPDDIARVLASYEDEHTVMAKVVYVTQPTELATVYSRDEFLSICQYAKSRDLYVYVDGARLAMAIASPVVDLTLEDIAANADMFYLGGTKVGGLYGEAIVIVNDRLKANFRHYIKQYGGLLAKARSIGAQFARFFDEDDLWVKMGARSNENAAYLASKLDDIGVKLAHPQITNQIFPLLPRAAVEKLGTDYGFYPWGGETEPQMIRLTCSWATSREAIDEFVSDIAELNH